MLLAEPRCSVQNVSTPIHKLQNPPHNTGHVTPRCKQATNTHKNAALETRRIYAPPRPPPPASTIGCVPTVTVNGKRQDAQSATVALRTHPPIKMPMIYLGEDVLFHLSLLDLVQRWTRDVHEPLFYQCSLRPEAEARPESGGHRPPRWQQR